MNNKQELNKQIKFGEENKKMKNLTNQDFNDIKGKLNYEHMVNGKKHTSKMIKLLQKRHAKNVSVIKSEYPYLSDNEISEILADYREYEDLMSAVETFTDLPVIYEDSNISKFLTKDDIAELKIAIEEMTIFVESLEDAE
ncbi:pathogenicity island protein [Staphylococcus haemolyticus]|uniref:pathogenicity island protein n=1 Tax=Staphylococcus haemolyticus TaxID=1283 RepID=UPI001F0B6267|nr:pathogenicity island protein [Staphylococcus haemolyticus]MCH4460455.1 pathogenicity island protein [Staphylococcus haemolyticus]MCH4484209.1 pathogenicity island protein [Staphylococcus haemolyticus]MCH4532638.1 pathogenicity island protein [Staphylococcus haemolyticus]